MDDLTFLPVESLRAACDTIAAQMYGFLLVRNSVIRAAGNHGYLGGKAAETFASEMALDLRLAGEIRGGRFRMELTRTEKVLRLLPIGQLALVAAGIYVRSPDEAVSAALMKAVAGISLTDPRLPGTLRITGIQQFQLAFGKARERSALVDWTKLTKEIARPIIAASNISYSDSTDSGWDDACDSPLDGSDRGIKLDFANFRSSVKRLIGRSRYSSEDEPVSYTCAQFKMIVDRLTLFADAIAADLDDCQPPDFDLGGSHVHAVHAVASAPMPPAPPSSNSRLTEKCWTVNCTSMTNSRRVCCLKCKTIRPGAWTCPTCGRGNAASTNICNATRDCYGDKTHSRALTPGSPEATRGVSRGHPRIGRSPGPLHGCLRPQQTTFAAGL